MSMNKKTQIANSRLRIEKNLFDFKGGSMQPALKEGYKVKIEISNGNNIEIGDIVVFGKGSLTCHRVIAKLSFFKKTYFVHKGDNASLGGKFESDDLVGRVVEVFSEEGQRVDKEKWANYSCGDRKVKGFIYLLLYLLKRFFLGEKLNYISCLINRFYWRCNR